MSDSIVGTTTSLLELAAELTAAWLGNPNTRASPDEVRAFLRAMHASVTELAVAGQGTPEPADATPEAYTPAVSVRKSLASPDHIISMIDGKPYRTLKRHLATNGLTPDQYRERYGLKPDYPMVAPNYSEQRRETAKRVGLGRKPKDGVATADGGMAEGEGTAAAAAEALTRSRRRLKLPEPS